MNDTLRWPLWIALLIIIVRVILEQGGASDTVANIFGINWLYFLVGVYFAAVVNRLSEPHPYKALLRLSLWFAFLTRLMLVPVYVAAYHYQWSAPRFSVERGGSVGPGVEALQGYLLVPLFSLLIGTILSALIMMLIGSLVLWVLRRRRPAPVRF